MPYKSNLLRHLVILISLQCLLVTCVDLTPPTLPIIKSQPSGSYLIKYLTPDTEYPVEMHDYSKKNTTKWFKYGSHAYVDELKELDMLFSFNKSHGHSGNNLVFKKYAPILLDHYETQPLFDEALLGVDEGAFHFF